MTDRWTALKQAMEKATAGPWYVAALTTKEPDSMTVYATGDDLNYICQCRDFMCFHEAPRNKDNAAFIALARNELPALLEENERKEAECARLRQDVNELEAEAAIMRVKKAALLEENERMRKALEQLRLYLDDNDPEWETSVNCDEALRIARAALEDKP